MRALRILVVDDDPDIRTIIELSLARIAGWHVRLAGSGRDAIAMAIAELPDAVLLDIMMPDMDGIRVLGELRSHPETRDVPVIFLTARQHRTDRDECLALGAAGVILKPFEPLELTEQIRALLPD